MNLTCENITYICLNIGAAASILSKSSNLSLSGLACVVGMVAGKCLSFMKLEDAKQWHKSSGNYDKSKLEVSIRYINDCGLPGLLTTVIHVSLEIIARLVKEPYGPALRNIGGSFFIGLQITHFFAFNEYKEFKKIRGIN